MGNVSGSDLKKSHGATPVEILDDLATSYILTMDFESMKRLTEKKYCDDLVILTSDIVERYFTESDVHFLAQRVKNGVEVNEMTHEKLRFIPKEHLETVESSNGPNKTIKKKRMCIGIAKFYIKTAHLFAAILTTVNPVYTYTDPSTGNPVTVPLANRHLIAPNVAHTMRTSNICENRIRALQNKRVSSDGSLWIRPNICGVKTPFNPKTALIDEPGIPQLRELYMDDKYDYSTGRFMGLSDAASQQLHRDLEKFYKAFTGKESMPASIKDFSDIPLRDYQNSKGCQALDSPFHKYVHVDPENELYQKYAANMAEMIYKTAHTQKRLTDLVSSLFVKTIDPHTKKEKIRLNPKLSNERLQNTIVVSRKIIVDLYVTCEADYIKGIKLFEAIVEYTIAQTQIRQLSSLKHMEDKLIREAPTSP
jgi:hypothetical protein